VQFLLKYAPIGEFLNFLEIVGNNSALADLSQVEN